MYLLLQNGRVFEGDCAGVRRDVMGEIVFSTGMTGYLETITDPSFYGQIVVQTFPLIGNYGLIPEDFEADKPFLAGYVVGNLCEMPSNFRSQDHLGHYFNQHGIVCLSGVDTRALTKCIREAGVMNAAIVESLDNKEELLKKLADHALDKPILKVTCKEIERKAPESVLRRIVLWDYGTKNSIEKELLKRNCEVLRVPANFSAEDIMKLEADGVLLSSGPGDPRLNTDLIEEVRKLCLTKTPIFGICMGHQLLALSQGMESSKRKYGHRGGNQPVKDIDSGRLYITSQNHGYDILDSKVPDGVKFRFKNANDNSCEGIQYGYMPAFSVQFHPEASSGPRDTRFLFDEFIAMVDENKSKN